MSREAEVAAFAGRWEAARKLWPYAGENPLTVGDELARLLRESNASKSSNSSTEPGDRHPGQVIAHSVARQWLDTPAAPAVGEDEALLAEASEHICPDHSFDCVDLPKRLATRLRAALSDLARLQKEKAAVETKLEQANEILAVDGREVE